MESLPKFILGLAVCFGLPAFTLVLRPYAAERSRQPVPYTSTDTNPELGQGVDTEFYERPDLKGTVYPAARVASKTRGMEVYAKMGCAQCHTQIIRPDFIGYDQYKKGWGAEQGAKGMAETRPSTPWDYLGEDFALIGQRRLGPDLANAGYRFNSALEVYQMLYAPRVRRAYSNHPSYPSLFDEVDIESVPRVDAISTAPYNVGVPEGKQIVASNDAKALAEYLLALKRDLPLPMSISGKTLADKKPAK